MTDGIPLTKETEEAMLSLMMERSGTIQTTMVMEITRYQHLKVMHVLNTYGTSFQDRFGCPDGDGDGYSNDGDVFPNDGDQWADSDNDGHGDNYYYDVQQFTELHINQRGDAFPMNPTQWNDTDGDGWGDNYDNASWTAIRPSDDPSTPDTDESWPGEFDATATKVDKFPLFKYQWADTDGDWIGDEPNTPLSDSCPNTWGNSSEDRIGCEDTDGDGWSNPTANWPAHPTGDADAFPADPTQWRDSDGDGFGDNTSGTTQMSALVKQEPHQLTGLVVQTLMEMDGQMLEILSLRMVLNGRTETEITMETTLTETIPDAFPDDSSQWADTDGDGYGDRPIIPNGDFFPNDPTQWSDMDNDGFGDDPNGNNGDQCPELYGKSTIPAARGCPDSDNDGVVDPFDDFPNDFYQQTDKDGDGYGDNPGYQTVMTAQMTMARAMLLAFWDAPMPTKMVMRTQRTHSLMTPYNGKILMKMAGEIIMAGKILQLRMSKTLVH